VDGKSSAARDNVTAWRRWEHPISAEVSSLMQDRRRLAAPDTELGRHVLRPGSSVEALAGEWRIWDLPEDVDPDVKRMAERERERVVAELEPEWMEALASFERDLSRSRRVASEIEARLRR
jgi:hypothetical protein